MNPKVKQNIEALKKQSGTTTSHVYTVRKTMSTDGLSAAIHTKKDADNFMADYKAAVKQAK